MANKYKRTRNLNRVFEVEAYIRRHGFVAEDIPKERKRGRRTGVLKNPHHLFLPFGWS